MSAAVLIRGGTVVNADRAFRADVLCLDGKVALVGIPLEPFAYDVSKAQIKEARVENVFRYAHVYPRAVAMIASGKIDVKPLLTDRYAFEDSVAAFDFARALALLESAQTVQPH